MLTTRWTAYVDPESPLPEYPRPQLRRDRWQNLNGRWDLAVVERSAPPPTEFTEQITIPFPAGSVLSGIERSIGPDDRLWMRRDFTPPPLRANERLRLHFGGVDWQSNVWCNGVAVGEHCGGFDPWHVDLTDTLTDGEQEIVVAVWDPTDTGEQPLGKQSLTPFAIQYSAVAGIWQTVWLEPISSTCIESVVTTTRLEECRVSVGARVTDAVEGDRVRVTAAAGSAAVGTGEAEVIDGNAVVELTINTLRPWSPDDPFLYDLDIRVHRDGSEIDHVESYFGAREVDIGKDSNGIRRLRLNGKPIFHLGLLDQGWWPDGLYTAPTDEALAYDIEITKAMGFNTIRKHVKVEPARWYWHADRVGVLVWQDMPSTRFDMAEFGRQMGQGTAPPQMDWSTISPGRDPSGFRRELDAVLDALEPFPSIVVWVPFNESWGQHDTDAVLEYVVERDSTRLVDGPSGWVDTGTGDIRDHHMYRSESQLPDLEDSRPLVYGEYGGLKLLVTDHVADVDGWGYSETHSAEEFMSAYEELAQQIAELVPKGLAGAIYTQTTDVESELNGLLTYDRAITKIPPDRLAPIHRRMFGQT